MISPRNVAQLGLASAIVVLMSCLVVLSSNSSSDVQLLVAQPGDSAPDFTLQSASTANPVSLRDFRGTPTLLYFCSIRCPVSNAYDGRIAELFGQYGKSSRVNFVAIHSGKAAESREDVSAQSTAAGLAFTHLLDPNGTVAAQYGATMTPTFLLLDAYGQTCYRGPLDDNQNREQVTRNYVQEAIAAVLAGHPVAEPTAQVHGCTIR